MTANFKKSPVAFRPWKYAAGDYADKRYRDSELKIAFFFSECEIQTRWEIFMRVSGASPIFYLSYRNRGNNFIEPWLFEYVGKISDKSEKAPAVQCYAQSIREIPFFNGIAHIIRHSIGHVVLTWKISYIWNVFISFFLFILVISFLILAFHAYRYY